MIDDDEGMTSSSFWLQFQVPEEATMMQTTIDWIDLVTNISVQDSLDTIVRTHCEFANEVATTIDPAAGLCCVIRIFQNPQESSSINSTRRLVLVRRDSPHNKQPNKPEPSIRTLTPTRLENQRNDHGQQYQ